MMWLVVRLLCKMWFWNFVVSLKLIVVEDDYDDDFIVDDLLMVTNSYMQNGDGIDDEIEDEMHVWKMKTKMVTICCWTYALLSHMFMHS